MSERLHGVIAEFDRAESLEAAVRDARDAGYTRMDAFSPFPLRETAALLGARPGVVFRIAVIAGLIGAILQYGSQYWMNAVDYPINVGGRPLHSWPAFLPSTVIVAILWAGAAALLSMLFILHLPRLHHPVFAVKDFERASEDRFFLLIQSDDPRFDLPGVHAFLQARRPTAVREVPA
ncbi:DUF3341 domain-containing protein [Microvirga pudoricolor]|uniref:DUF3341 domain-containing protein n=1 Tax=Microvirga pudoricolor TaxID=2778729 RepID=UPI001951D3BD|nr:DUF3341 domain-containing protein [Microvirga pudoricolor]MBM6594942.1 DUF3341 domain-containing protein [Microvirga pudoricolor]